jgi:hypothetical protein
MCRAIAGARKSLTHFAIPRFSMIDRDQGLSGFGSVAIGVTANATHSCNYGASREDTHVLFFPVRPTNSNAPISHPLPRASYLPPLRHYVSGFSSNNAATAQFSQRPLILSWIF